MKVARVQAMTAKIMSRQSETTPGVSDKTLGGIANSDRFQRPSRNQWVYH